MSVNRFDQPVQAQYISQYTPIPFEQLYQMGKEYNARVDNAYKQLNDQINAWSKFRSPSEVDTKRWYQLTDPTEIINQMTSNPDMLKTAQGRRQIQQFINSVPYDQLSMLEQSRDAMLERQKLEQQLSLEGKYNPLWHAVDYTNYDTLNTRIFDDLNLIPYKSEVDLVKPYVDNLKSSYLYTKGGYDYSGVSTDATDEQVKRNWTAIYNTPEAQMHINALIKQGFTPQQAQELFANRVYQAGREFAYKNREANPFSMLWQKYQYSKPQGSEVTQNGPFYLTQSIEATGLQRYLASKANQLTNNPRYAKLYEDSRSSDPVIRNQANEELQKMMNYTPTQLFRDILDKYGTTDSTGRTQLNQYQLEYGVNDIMNNFSTSVQAGPLKELLSSTIDGISTDTQNTPLGKRKIISGGENMNLMSRIVSGIAGFSPKEPEETTGSRNKVLNNLKAGNFTNMILMSNDKVLVVPTIKNGKQTSLMVQQVKVAISDDDVKRLGLTDADMKKAMAREINSSGSYSSTETLSGDYSDGEKKYEKVSSSSTNKPGTKYWELTLGNELPTEGTKAEYLNQAALKLNIGSTGYTPEYPSVQNQAFGFDD